MTIRWSLPGGLFVLLGVLTGACVPLSGSAGDLPGKSLFAVCESCHGVGAEGNRALNAPALAGLDAGYLTRQMNNFRQGLRGEGAEGSPGRAMRDMAALLQDESQVTAVSTYVASLPAAPVPDATVRGNAGRGKELFRTCIACHGENARGNPQLNSPALAGQADWYLLRQLEDFRDGRRGASAGDTDGAQMRAMARSLGNPQALRDVVSYIQSLSVPASAPAASMKLSDRCPPSFEKRDGLCVFRSLYELYDLPAGHGGLRAPLPPMRASFSPEQIDLGRYLFFDPLLSGDRSLACASCHRPDMGFADGRARSLGHTLHDVAGSPRRVILARNAPTLWNVGFLPRLFWDARADSLQAQASGPLFSADEMAGTPASLEAALNASKTYRSLFAQAFKRSPGQPILTSEVTGALAAFESSLVSFNSRYDRYAFGDQSALNAEEIAGYNIFRGFVARCSQCHMPPLFTSGDVAVVGAPASPGQPYDAGVETVTHEAVMRGAFKVPTLRNIALTAPYFQAGQFASLSDVIRFYNDTAGHAVPAGEHLEVQWHIAMKGPTLSEAEQRALVAFLLTLTDESMMPAIPVRLPSGLPLPGEIVRVARRSTSSTTGR